MDTFCINSDNTLDNYRSQTNNIGIIRDWLNTDTGQKYSTVIYHCKIGSLKARQDAPCCTWQILASELDRYQKETI